MKIRNKRIIGASLPKESCAKSSSERYKRLSYYVLGGVELNGKALSDTAPVAYDNEETIAEMEKSKAGVLPIGACDPTVDFFDIAEKTSTTTAEKATADGITPQVKPAETEITE